MSQVFLMRRSDCAAAFHDHDINHHDIIAMIIELYLPGGPA
jgi:hypothetical protein